MQGNSLLESYEGIELSKLAGTISIESNSQKDLWGRDSNAQRSIFDTKHIDTDKINELVLFVNHELEVINSNFRITEEIDNG